jgi:hypothetical protein
MADSEKPSGKKPVSDKDTTILSQGRIQMKPAAKKVTYTTSVLKCVCQSTIYGAYCFVHYNKAKVDQPIISQVAATEDLSDSIDEPEHDIESTKEHLEKEVKALAALVEDKKRKKQKAAKAEKAAHDAPQYADEDACVFKWKQIAVGTEYKAMSVGKTPRSRTGIVLVPIKTPAH